MSSATTKRIPIQDTDGGTFQISTSSGDTLGTVRSEMTNLRSRFLNSPQPGHFRFFMNNRLLTLEEERSERAWDAIEAGHTVVLLPVTVDPLLAEDGKKRSISQNGLPIPNKKVRDETHIGSLSQNVKTPPAQSPANCIDLTGQDSSTESVSLFQQEDDQLIPHVTPTLATFQPDLSDLNNSEQEDTHVKIDKCHLKCLQLLAKANEFINKPDLQRFCPQSHRLEWTKEIQAMAQQVEPEIIIGCLGGTGVGKSSLLKALLNEDNILPTSSSRGCTAAVVELKFNRAFCKPQNDANIAVYRGQVDFISFQDWKDELALLIDDCCNEETGAISCRRKLESEDAAAAFGKIDSVYGSGTMNSHDGKHKDNVFKVLCECPRVAALLRSPDGAPNNVVEVTEGEVSASEATKLLQLMKSRSNVDERKLARKKKKWADLFRKQINGYVYRKGNGKEPQTWPLIRKVVLYGPWNVLSTGACLVDLPGVRDENAARAKVAEKYLQHCTKIWIVAPIKRAVDDKTAKDLLGEEFKRRLLMDGNYSNVSFICTHSDDCEISEIMHDHEDVAKEKPGRWEQMLTLRDTISMLAKNDEDLEDENEDIQEQLEGIRAEKKNLHGREGNVTLFGSSLESLTKKEHQLQERMLVLEKYCGQSPHQRETKRKESHKLLKILAAEVRNEFSRKSLQDDFRKGIEELVRQPENGKESVISNVLPPDFCLEVLCTASNEYLKLQGIKVGSDGMAMCFESVAETGIPAVMQSVRDTTEKFRVDHAKSFLKNTGSILGRIYLYASECKVDASAGQLFTKAFQSEMSALAPAVEQVSIDFGEEMVTIVLQDLEPHLRVAATRGDTDGTGIVNAWFSSKVRNRQAPNNKGIHWATLGAAARRGGYYKSATSGPVSLNQELCNPLEKEYCSAWRDVIVAELSRRLCVWKDKLLKHCKERLERIGQAFGEIGMDSLSVAWIEKAGLQGCESVVDSAFQRVSRLSSKKGRKLNRSSVSKIRTKMMPSYTAVAYVERGPGRASRQMYAMKAGAKNTLTLKEFDTMMTELNKEILSMVQELTTTMQNETQTELQKCLERVCCLSWYDQEYIDSMKDPNVFVEVFDCRNALLPNLVRLCAAHDVIQNYMNIPCDVTMQRVDRNEPKGYQEAKQQLANKKSATLFSSGSKESI